MNDDDQAGRSAVTHVETVGSVIRAEREVALPVAGELPWQVKAISAAYAVGDAGLLMISP